MVGMGGIMTEIMKDVAFRMLPITTKDARSMLDELRGAELLHGFRGSEPIDTKMVSKMLVKIGKMAMDNADYINSIDFNPVVVYPKSYRVVDAKIILNDEVRAGSVSKAKPDKSHMEEFFTPPVHRPGGRLVHQGQDRKLDTGQPCKLRLQGPRIPHKTPRWTRYSANKCYKSIGDIPGEVDMVVVSIRPLQDAGGARGVRQEGRAQHGHSVRRAERSWAASGPSTRPR